ncbi:MAG TPA: YihY/virulence factor BrkB family protein [Roseiarcus sp.]
MPARQWPYLGLAAIYLLARQGQERRGQAQRRSSGSFDGPRDVAPLEAPRARAEEPGRGGEAPKEAQGAGAAEPGRGRAAKAPWQIPWKGWKDILWRSYQELNDNRLLAVAGGVVFFGLLALFPAITAIVSLYGLFANPSTINDQLSMASGILPSGALDVIREEVNRLAHSSAKLGVGFVGGLVVALWSANAGTKAVIDALNVAYDEKEKRSFVTLNLASLAFTIAGIVAVLLAISAVVVLPLVLNFLGLGSFTGALLNVARWPLLLAVVIVGLAALYRYGPSRREPRWRWLTVGSGFAAVSWLVGSALLSWYLASFANYDATYGSLGAGVGMMMWMWVSSIVILVGAQLNAEIERQTAEDSTAESDKPLGARGAVVADTVGKAQP